MKDKAANGVLTSENGKFFLQGKSGGRHLESDLIWSGYIQHWSGKRLIARYLPQCDYEQGKPIVIMRPYTTKENIPFMELYYNERLIKYPASTLGHIAININGDIFNFSHLLNENEVLSEDEYFYRPALGEFAPHPETGAFNVEDSDKPYYDKFGRLFMRTIHVIRIVEIDTDRLSEIFHNSLEAIHNTPVNPKKPEKFRDFNVFTRSCTTIIRDGLREYGFRNIRGIFPRDLFINAAYNLFKIKNDIDISIKLFTMKQLKVPEAPYSAVTPLLNVINRFRQRRLHII